MCFSGSSMGCLLRKTAFHKLLQCETFPHDAVFQECFSIGSFHQKTSFTHRCSMASVSTGPQVQLGAETESLLQHLEHLLPSFFTDLGVSRLVPLTHSHFFLTTAAVNPIFLSTFLNMLSQSFSQQHCLAQLWPAAGPPCSQLALALSNTASVIF